MRRLPCVVWRRCRTPGRRRLVKRAPAAKARHARKNFQEKTSEPGRIEYCRAWPRWEVWACKGTNDEHKAWS